MQIIGKYLNKEVCTCRKDEYNQLDKVWLLWDIDLLMWHGKVIGNYSFNKIELMAEGKTIVQSWFHDTYLECYKC